MPVRSICTHTVAVIAPDADVVTAAEKMREAHVGDLVVIEYREGRQIPIGIITDRDIVVGVVAKGVDPTKLTVADVMSAELLTVHEENGIEFALREMRRVGVRRAPVVGTHGELVGVLSIVDALDHFAAALGHIADIIRLGQQLEADMRP